MEEQTVTTNEINRSMAEAAKGVGDISKNITGVAVAAKDTTQGANNTQKAAQELTPDGLAAAKSGLALQLLKWRAVSGRPRMSQGLHPMLNALVVDDSRAIRMILGRTLREPGLRSARSGKRRRGPRRPEKPVPGRPGHGRLEHAGRWMAWNCCATSARTRFSAAVPVVMVTTEAEVEQMTAALAAGATEYIMKPFTTDILPTNCAWPGWWSRA